LKIKSSRINPVANIPKPIPIAKKAIDILNNVGLPVFLNPIYEIVPITNLLKVLPNLELFQERIPITLTLLLF